MPSPSIVLTPPNTEGRNEPVDPNLIRIRDLIYKVCGIFLPNNKMFFLQDRARRRLRELHIETFGGYYDILTTGADRTDETRSLLNEITVGETCFFRNQPQLSAVQKMIIPKIMQSKAKIGLPQLKIWSAGCSTGEEPYTLAIMLTEISGSVLRGWSWEIIATDLNDNSLNRAQQGLYDEYAVRNVETLLRTKYFRREGDRYQLSADIRKKVNFSRLNLQDESKLIFMRAVDIIFCANVLIYFDGASKRRTVQHFYNALVPGGYFFLGHSESLYGIHEKFQLVHFPGATAYLRAPDSSPAGGQR
jgi:chemotaxis protein methyltransferase CheR